MHHYKRKKLFPVFLKENTLEKQKGRKCFASFGSFGLCMNVSLKVLRYSVELKFFARLHQYFNSDQQHTFEISLMCQSPTWTLILK